MLQELEKLNVRDRAFLLMVVRREGSNSQKMLSFIPSNYAQQLEVPLQHLLDLSIPDKEREFAEAFAELRGEGKKSLFYYADATWIKEAFQGEGPRIMSLILQELPKTRVGGVLKDLSKEMRRSLKKVPKLAPPEMILSLIKKEISSKFPSISQSVLSQDEVVENLSQASLEDFKLLVHELGLSEMALAFQKVNRSAVRSILNRLPHQDAKALTKRIKKGFVRSSKEQREAQLHILSLEFEKLEPEEIIHEIGFAVLSKAFGEGDEELVTFFTYRLPPKLGYLLKRYVDHNLSNNTHAQALQIRERILDAYTRLKIGK